MSVLISYYAKIIIVLSICKNRYCYERMQTLPGVQKCFFKAFFSISLSIKSPWDFSKNFSYFYHASHWIHRMYVHFLLFVDRQIAFRSKFRLQQKTDSFSFFLAFIVIGHLLIRCVIMWSSVFSVIRFFFNFKIFDCKSVHVQCKNDIFKRYVCFCNILLNTDLSDYVRCMQR